MIAYLLAVIAGVGGIGAGGHSAIAAPFRDPGTWLAAARTVGYHSSLRAFLGHLLGALVRGHTVVAACACVAWHTVGHVGSCTCATYFGLGRLLLPWLAAVSTLVGAVAAAISAAAIFTAAAVTAWHAMRSACTAAFTLGTSLWGGVPLRFILPKLLPHRLMAILGRVFPQIPPPGYSTSHHSYPTRWASPTGRTRSHTCVPLITRASWQSRFHHLHQHCKDDLVRAPSAAPWLLLPLLLQIAAVSALDLGARAINLRTTPAGMPPHGPIVGVPTTPALERASTTCRQAASAACDSRRLIRRTCHTAVLLIAVLSAQLLHYMHREPHPFLRTADELAGRLIGNRTCRAAIYVLNAPTHVARLNTYLSYLVLKMFLVLFLRTVTAHHTLMRWKRHLWCVASYLASAAWTATLCLLLLAEIRAFGGSPSPKAVVMPLPSSIQSLPPAAVASVSRLDAPRATELSPHASATPRRVGYALRRAKRQGVGDAKAAARPARRAAGVALRPPRGAMGAPSGRQRVHLVSAQPP